MHCVFPFYISPNDDLDIRSVRVPLHHNKVIIDFPILKYPNLIMNKWLNENIYQFLLLLRYWYGDEIM